MIVLTNESLSVDTKMSGFKPEGKKLCLRETEKFSQNLGAHPLRFFYMVEPLKCHSSHFERFIEQIYSSILFSTVNTFRSRHYYQLGIIQNMVTIYINPSEYKY